MSWTNRNAVRKFAQGRTGEFMEAVDAAAVRFNTDHGVDFRAYIQTEIDTFDDIAKMRQARRNLVDAGFTEDSEAIQLVDAELTRRVPKQPVEETPPLAR